MCLTALAMVLAVPFCEMDGAERGAFLAEVCAEQEDFAARLWAVAEASLGTPYADGPLGEGPGAPFDDGPLIDPARVDCVTFCEQTIAYAAACDPAAAKDLLQTIRYDGGRVAFEHRNHFMLADWLPNNLFCEEVTADLGVPVARITRTVGRRYFWGLHDALQFAEDQPGEELTVAIVPVDEAAAAEAKLPDAALICFVGKLDWLFALHTGLYLRDASGAGKLYHASSKSGEVVSISLERFLADSAPRYLGFTAHAIEKPEPAEDAVSAKESVCEEASAQGGD